MRRSMLSLAASRLVEMALAAAGETVLAPKGEATSSLTDGRPFTSSDGRRAAMATVPGLPTSAQIFRKATR